MIAKVVYCKAQSNLFFWNETFGIYQYSIFPLFISIFFFKKGFPFQSGLKNNRLLCFSTIFHLLGFKKLTAMSTNSNFSYIYKSNLFQNDFQMLLKHQTIRQFTNSIDYFKCVQHTGPDFSFGHPCETQEYFLIERGIM